MTTSENIEKILKGAFLILISMVLGKLFSYLYIVLVATKLGAHDYGVLSLGLAISSFITAFSLLGLDEGIIRFVPFYRGKNDFELIKGTIHSSFKTVLNTSIYASVLLIIFSDYIANNIFNEFELTLVLFFLAIALPFSATAQIFLTSFRAFQKPVYEVLIKEILEKFLRFIITLILVSFGFKLLGALMGFLIAILIMFATAIYFFNKNIFNIFNKDTISKNNKKELLNYSLPLLLKNFMWLIIAWTDLLMLGYFKTTEDVGIYNVSLPTANLIIIPAFGLMYLFLPIISELYAKNNLEEIKNIYITISKYTFLINLPIFIILSILAKDIITLFFGQEYIAAAYPLQILTFGYLIYSLSDVSTNILAVLKKSKTIFIIIASFALTNVILNYFLIPKYSIIGAAIATSISFLIGAMLIISITYHHIKIHPFMFKPLKIIISGLLTTIIIVSIKNYLNLQPMFNILISSLIMLIIYVPLLFLLKAVEKEDLEILYNIKNKFIK